MTEDGIVTMTGENLPKEVPEMALFVMRQTQSQTIAYRRLGHNQGLLVSVVEAYLKRLTDLYITQNLLNHPNPLLGQILTQMHLNILKKRAKLWMRQTTMMPP